MANRSLDGHAVTDFEQRTTSVNAQKTELCVSSDGSPYFFVSLRRIGHLNSKRRNGSLRARAETCNNVLRDFAKLQRRAAKAIGSDDWELGSPHDLRRTFCTMMADIVPSHVVKTWAGHSDIAATAQFYLGINRDHEERTRSVARLQTSN